MAGELPLLLQEFAVSSAEFVAGIDEMINVVDRLTLSLNLAAEAAARLDGTGADAAAGADANAAATTKMTDAERAAAEAAARESEAIRALLLSMDELVTAADEVTVAVDRQVVAMDRTIKANEESAGSSVAWGSKFKSAFVGVSIAVVASIAAAAKFQSVMTTLLTQAGVAKSQFSGLESGVLALAGQVGFSPTSLAKALYHVESSFQSTGITGSHALSLLRVAAEGAATGHADLVDVTNALDATIASGVTGIHNYSQAMGALNAVVGAGDMTMQDLADAMGTGMMAVAKSYGQSLIQVGAALATLGDNNIRGAKAATDLRMAWQAVQAPLKSGVDVLAQLGLGADTLANTMEHHGLSAALQQFVQHLQASKIPMDQWGQMITEIFGKRAGVGIGVLIDQLERLKRKLPDVQRGADDFGRAWKTTQQTVSQQWAQLKSGVEGLAISFGTLLLPAATKVVSLLVKFVNFLEQHKGLAAFAGGLLAIFGALKLIAGLRAGLMATAGAISLIGQAAAADVPEVTALDAVMDANVIALLLVAILALAVGLYELYKHSKLVRDIVHDVARFFAGVWRDAMHVAGQVINWFVHGPLAFIKQQLGVFSQWWKTHGDELKTVAKVVWGQIWEIIHLFWSFASAYVRAGLKILQIEWTIIWTFIRDFVRGIWDMIAVIIRTAVNLILDIIGIALDLLTGHWHKAWVDAKKFASDGMNGIVNIITTAASGFKNLLWDAGKALITGFIGGIKSMFGPVGGVMHDLAGVASSFLPFSPAKRGPLSGRGDPRYSGQSIARSLALGITDGRDLVGSAMSGLLSGHGARGLSAGVAGGFGGGGAVTVNVHVDGYIGSNAQLAHEIFMIFQQQSLQNNHRNATNGLALAAGRG